MRIYYIVINLDTCSPEQRGRAAQVLSAQVCPSLSLSLRLSVGVACGRAQLCCSVRSLFEPVSHSFSLNMAVVQLVILK